MLKQKQNYLTILIIIIVNLLFVIKYSFVYSKIPLLIIIAFVLAFLLLLLLLSKLSNSQFIKKIPSKSFGFIIVFINFIMAAVTAVLPDMFGQIGRLPAINEWITLLLNHKFPYYAVSTPSGFPMLFFFAFPFYVAGMVKFFALIGLFLFSFMVYKTYSSPKELIFQFALLFTAPIFYYDLLVKSELFLNMMLPIFLFYFILKYFNVYSYKSLLVFGIFAGLVLSTRSTVAVIYILFFIPYLKSRPKTLLIFGSITLLVFILTLLPFILWDFEGFMQKGPFAVQSFLSYLPKYIIFAFIAAVILISFKIYNLNSFFFQTGFLLFLIVIFSYYIKVQEFGWYVALIEDKIDLSYLDFCFPFLILAFKEKPIYNFKNNNFIKT